MNIIKQNIASVLCVAAGLLLVGQWLVEGSDMNDVMGVAIGTYFIGKGFFIRETLNYQRKMLDRV